MQGVLLAVLPGPANAPGPGQGPDPSVAQVQGADLVVPRIGDQQRVVDERESLRRPELGLLRRPIAPARVPASEDLEDLSVRGGQDDPVVQRVADGHAAAVLRDGNLSRGREQGGREAVLLQGKGQGMVLQVCPVALRDPLDHASQPLLVPLATDLADPASVRGEHREGRPGADAITLHEAPVRVADDRVAAIEAHHRAAQGLQVPLVVELGGVHTDHDQPRAEAVLQASQLLGHVDAIDAAVGPEIQDDHPATQVASRQGTGHVQPVETLGQAQGRTGSRPRLREGGGARSKDGEEEEETAERGQGRQWGASPRGQEHETSRESSGMRRGRPSR